MGSRRPTVRARSTLSRRRISPSSPLELLGQADQLRQIFISSLGLIAAISLVVGHGIMNIMLAIVTERTREIGIPRAGGQTARDILSSYRNGRYRGAAGSWGWGY